MKQNLDQGIEKALLVLGNHPFVVVVVEANEVFSIVESSFGITNREASVRVVLSFLIQKLGQNEFPVSWFHGNVVLMFNE